MEEKHQEHAKIFKAFCDPKRLAILEQLRSGEKCACKLQEPLNLTQSGLPLRYNKDKRKNPVFSRVSAFVVAYSIPFPTLIANEKSVE